MASRQHDDVLTDTICTGVIIGPCKVQHCSGRGISLMLTQSPLVASVLMMFMHTSAACYVGDDGSSSDVGYQLARTAIVCCSQHYLASHAEDHAEDERVLYRLDRTLATQTARGLLM